LAGQGKEMRILIADDHGLYRRGLRAALEAAIPGIEVIEANGIDATLAQLEQAGPIDLALVDLEMTGLVSLNILREIHEFYPETRFAIISASDARLGALEALASGLHGFISKSQRDEEIIAGVNDILSGRIYVPPIIASRAAGAAEAREKGVRMGSKGGAGKLDMDRLTPRQRDVLELIAAGLSNKEIARKLNIAEATTKIHIAGLMRALGVRNRTEAAVLVRDWLDQQQK
jgi:DNA-binding NarL/FixJ family response regulator